MENSGMNLFQWLVVIFGGGITFTGGGMLILLGRKMQKLDELDREIKEIQDDSVLRKYCKERHKTIDKRLDSGEEKFDTIIEGMSSIRVTLARIDERTEKQAANSK